LYTKGDTQCLIAFKAPNYFKAGNAFKVTKNWDRAGMAFVKAAEAHQQVPNAKHEAAQAYLNASHCYKKTDPKLAIKLAQKGVDMYTDEGQVLCLIACVYLTMH